MPIFPPSGGLGGYFEVPAPGGTVDIGPAIRTKVAEAAAAGGGVVVLPAGNARLKSQVNVTSNGIVIDGLSKGRCTITIDDTAGNIGDGFRFLNTFACRAQNFTLSAVSARTAGAGIRVTGGDPNLHLSSLDLLDSSTVIDDVDMVNQFNGIVIDSADSTHLNWRVYVRGGRHRGVAVNGTGIWINTVAAANKFGASQFISDFWVGQTPAATLAGIRLTGTGDVTVRDTETFGTTYGILIDPPANGFLTSATIEGGFYDTAGTSCLLVSPNASVGRFGAIKFLGTWFAGTAAGPCALLNGAAAKDVLFQGCTFYSAVDAGGGGWGAIMNASSGISFLGCDFSGCAAGGVVATGNAERFMVQGSRFWNGIGTGGTGLPVGIEIQAGSDHYTVTGNDLSDAGVVTKITNTPGASAARRIVQDNVTA